MMNSIQPGALPQCERIESAGQDRPWLVMIHGASQHRGIFNAQVEAFKGDYRLLLMDLPGHGRSAAIPGPYGFMEYAESVLAGLDHCGITTMHYWGTHTGAAVGLLLAATGQRHRFESMILDGAVLPGVAMPSITTTIGRAKETARSRGMEAARKEWFDRAEWFAVMRAHPLPCRAAEHWAMIREFEGGPWLDTHSPRALESVEDILPGLNIPTLLINGEHDVPDFMATATRIAAALPDARHQIIPGAGGFPLWEFPDRVNQMVRLFLAGLMTSAQRDEF
jgi:pimeloyl-ACP methyl ester carboxylesterase